LISLSSMTKGEFVSFIVTIEKSLLNKKVLENLSQITRSSISKLYCLFFLLLTIYKWLAIEIHVYHDAAPEVAQVPVLWLESYCGLSNGRSDDFVVFTTLYL
jgi:hypothetical protein